MLKSIALVGIVGFAATLGAKINTFDAGGFTVSVDETSEIWESQSWPKFNTLHLIRHPGIMFNHVADMECYVYVDRITDKVMPGDLGVWFTDYVKQRHAFLDHVVFNKLCRFEPASRNPVSVGDYTLYELDMRPRSYLEHGAVMPTIEQGIAYFLVLPGIETHRTFFVFTGHQVFPGDDPRRPSLGNVMDLVQGFRFGQTKAEK